MMVTGSLRARAKAANSRSLALLGMTEGESVALAELGIGMMDRGPVHLASPRIALAARLACGIDMHRSIAMQRSARVHTGCVAPTNPAVASAIAPGAARGQAGGTSSRLAAPPLAGVARPNHAAASRNNPVATSENVGASSKNVGASSQAAGVSPKNADATPKSLVALQKDDGASSKNGAATAPEAVAWPKNVVAPSQNRVVTPTAAVAWSEVVVAAFPAPVEVTLIARSARAAGGPPAPRRSGAPSWGWRSRRDGPPGPEGSSRGDRFVAALRSAPRDDRFAGAFEALTTKEALRRLCTKLEGRPRSTGRLPSWRTTGRGREAATDSVGGEQTSLAACSQPHGKGAYPPEAVKKGITRCQ